MPLLEVVDLSVRLGVLAPLEGISFSADRGEILGIVGESGSGKSLTAISIMGLLHLLRGEIVGGKVVFDGDAISAFEEKRYRRLRGRRISFVAQNPMTSLDPVVTVGHQVAEVLIKHLSMSKSDARARSIEIMTQMQIPDAAQVFDRFPHQLSGGMKQRIAIAMALAGEPDLIVADEPTTALDVTVQAQIIGLLTKLVRERNVAMILITHDMSVVAQCCDRVVVLYAGRVAEIGSVSTIFSDPRHPYTRALIGCIPFAGVKPRSLSNVPGAVPSVAGYPAGCRFHPRCGKAWPRCGMDVPRLVTCADGGRVACHLFESGQNG